MGEEGPGSGPESFLEELGGGCSFFFPSVSYSSPVVMNLRN